jgi:hypothetical protein
MSRIVKILDAKTRSNSKLMSCRKLNYSNREMSGKVMTPKQQHDGLQNLHGMVVLLRDGLRAGEK